MSKTTVTLIAIGVIFVIFLGISLGYKTYIEPKIVDSAVKKIQEQIDKNYKDSITKLNSDIKVVDGKIADVEKKRAKIAKDVEELKGNRNKFVPPKTVEETVKLLKEMGYEVTVKPIIK
jgi:chorismate mutase